MCDGHRAALVTMREHVTGTRDSAVISEGACSRPHERRLATPHLTLQQHHIAGPERRGQLGRKLLGLRRGPRAVTSQRLQSATDRSRLGERAGTRGLRPTRAARRPLAARASQIRSSRARWQALGWAQRKVLRAPVLRRCPVIRCSARSASQGPELSRCPRRCCPQMGPGTAHHRRPAQTPMARLRPRKMPAN